MGIIRLTLLGRKNEEGDAFEGPGSALAHVLSIQSSLIDYLYFPLGREKRPPLLLESRQGLALEKNTGSTLGRGLQVWPSCDPWKR